MPPVAPATRRTALVRWARGRTHAAGALGGLAVVLLIAACGGAAEPPPPSLRFTDVTAESGLSYIQHEFRDIPDCIFAGEPRGATGCLVERATGGAAAADYDGDGWIDLFVTRLDGPGLLFRNQGDGTFADVTEAAGLAAFSYPTNGAWWGDIDNDGDQDLFVTTIAAPRFLLYINDGAGSFREEAVARGAAVADEAPRAGMSVAMGDFDRDGWLDIHTTEWRLAQFIDRDEPANAHARLLRNRGAEKPGFFEDVTGAAGVSMTGAESLTNSGLNGDFSFGTAFVDLDADGWPDLAVAGDYGRSRLFWNNGDGTFRDGTVAAGVGTDENGMGSTFADVDGDGDLDWFVTAIASSFPCLGGPSYLTGMCEWRPTGNRLFAYEGGRRFSDQTDAADVRDGFWGWGAAFFDADNDGDQDLIMTNGFVLTEHEEVFNDDPMRLWENDGAGAMTERSAAAGVVSMAAGKGLLTFDYDRDGDLDVFIVNNAGEPTLYRNDGGNQLAWLRIRLVGATSNRDAIGARVEVEGDAGGVVQLREAGVATHFLGQSESTLHFGLRAAAGEAPAVARVTVTWPASGIRTVLEDVPANATIVIREGDEGYTPAP
jgi:hypothetical protein